MGFWVSKTIAFCFYFTYRPKFFSGKKEIHKKELEISTLAAKIFIYNNWNVVEVLRYNTESSWSREWIKGLLEVIKSMIFFFLNYCTYEWVKVSVMMYIWKYFICTFYGFFL